MRLPLEFLDHECFVTPKKGTVRRVHGPLLSNKTFLSPKENDFKVLC